MEDSHNIPHRNKPLNHRKTWLRRYFSVTSMIVLCFMAYLFFFSDTSVLKRYSLQKSIDSLEAQVKTTSDSVEKYRRMNADLRNDTAAIEQVVRERHNMTRPNEDVYIFYTAEQENNQENTSK